MCDADTVIGMTPERPVPNFIKRRCPGCSEMELHDAYQRFQQYLAITYHIYQRLRAERDSRESAEPDRFGDVGQSSSGAV
jgi:hypothetical protein